MPGSTRSPRASTERGVTLIHEAPGSTWMFDADQMARALGNLVINAIQHAPRGSGRVEVHVSIGANGPGIADEALDEVFEAFHTARAEGSGLGLSIARAIVEAHGGTARARSRDEAATTAFTTPGALFLIDLPWPAS